MNDNCNHQEKIKKSTKRKLCNSNITTSKKTAIHIQIIFHGKENRCIVIVNCNAGFQDPRYLGFYNGTTMKIIKNSFDLELLYKEYLLFCKENNPEDRGKIWDYIDNFSRQELRNHFNKINF